MAALLVTHPAHFVRGPDGRVHASDTFLGADFWARYLTVFDRVGVLARVQPVDALPPDAVRADGERVRFHDLPDYVGPWQYLRCRRMLGLAIDQAMGGYDAYCLRTPCPIANLTWRVLQRRGLPFGVEITGDPWDSLSAGTVSSLARPIARRTMARTLRAQCKSASATAYVTRQALQRRYPPAADAFTTHYSSIELPENALVAHARSDFTGAQRIVFVGTLAVLYKAPDVLIRSLQKIGRSDLRLTIVGDGRERLRIERLAEECGVAGHTTFLGRLPAGQAIREVLDASDVFVLPSRQEGVPRAMIEAMARGLPCIGSTVGGIPELLPPEDLVPPGDVALLADKIVEFLDHPDRLTRASRQNLDRCRDYLDDVLADRRKRFYEEVRRICSTAPKERQR